MNLLNIILKELRQSKNQTIDDMAEELSVEVSFLYSLEQGKAKIPYNFARRIQQAYSLSDKETVCLNFFLNLLSVKNTFSPKYEFASFFADNMDGFSMEDCRNLLREANFLMSLKKEGTSSSKIRKMEKEEHYITESLKEAKMSEEKARNEIKNSAPLISHQLANFLNGRENSLFIFLLDLKRSILEAKKKYPYLDIGILIKTFFN